MDSIFKYSLDSTFTIVMTVFFNTVSDSIFFTTVQIAFSSADSIFDQTGDSFFYFIVDSNFDTESKKIYFSEIKNIYIY